ncbi:DUF262 domain-containing protein [Mesorhizobium kowhaii]|uniref:DUF262 domain-containing protein n=1 Tax=Mesorhizobium kowhaii TaxID=1300272 RepID=UPI00142D67D9|nr:DUF262 domain-containing protein [Mesorhizobium kowhaii]
MESIVIDLDYDQVSSLLSELSQPSPLPKLDGSPKAPRAFDSADVSFDSSDWLARVLQVGIWLNLDGSFDAEDAPETVALRLFDELAPGKAGDSFAVNDGLVQLTELGAQHLEERLSRAAGNRSLFLQLIEEERSVAAATEAWVEAWDEPVAVEPLSINASVDKWRIYDLAARASQQQLELNPTYQRDFVWSNSDSQMLIESILRGIPLPSIILAKVSNSQRYQIVDGKQRLTAILRFMGSHPEGLENAKLMKDYDVFKTNFAQFARRNTLRATDIRQKYLPFKTRKYPDGDPLAKLGGRYYCDIRNEPVRIAGETITVADLFEQACDYFIPVLIYKDTQVRDIHRVFRLYNQQGMKLNAEEIRNAVFNHLLISRAMLFVSGDRPESTIAPELVKAGINPSDAHEIINALGFGVSRFRRTKVLLWTVATLILKPAQAPDKTFRTPSTASHIDEFLRSIDNGRLAQFKSTATLERLSSDIVAALALHQVASDAWHPKFRRKGKSEMASRWEELPVVASVLACFVLVVMGEEGRLTDGLEDIRKKTANMVGPASTQNKTQWAHIANSSTLVLEALGIDLAAAHVAVTERYGDSAVEALIEIRKIPIG